MTETDINNPVIKQDNPINNRKNVANPKNTTSITSSRTPMIRRASWIETKLCRPINLIPTYFNFTSEHFYPKVHQRFPWTLS